MNIRLFVAVLLVVLTAGLSARSAWAVDLPIQGGPGGGSFRSSCPPGAFVTGVDLHTGAWVDQISARCAYFGNTTYRLDTPAAASKPAGGNGGGLRSASCPDNQHYVSGIKVGFTRDGNQPKYLDYVEITCFPISGGSEVKICVDSGDKCWDRHPNPGPYNGYGLSFTAGCPIEQAVTGFVGRSGSYVDAIAPSCGPRVMDPGTLPNHDASISVGFDRTQLGPSACATGRGFSPGGTVDISYFGMPGVFGYQALSQGRPGPKGMFFTRKGGYDALSTCANPDDAFGNVMIVATEKDGSGKVVASARSFVTSALWCPGRGGGSYNYSCTDKARTEPASQ